MPMRYGRPDLQFADALSKVSPELQKKVKASSQDFEAVFLNSMFSQMTSSLKGDGPFGDTTGTGVWRSMLTEEYSKSFAKAGGIGISNDGVPHADHAAGQPYRLDARDTRNESSILHGNAAAPNNGGVDGGRGPTKLAEILMDVMSALLGVIERETELVRAGKVREAMALEPQKTDLSRRYVSAVGHLKASQKYLAQTAPELLTTLHRHHDVFRAMLQINLTVLATAHAVSEGIVRGVNTEMQRRNIALHIGRSAAGYCITPLSVSRFRCRRVFHRAADLIILIKITRRFQRRFEHIL